MKLNDKQVLLSIKALSHYVNTALQFVPNDDEEKVHARALLQCMEDVLLRKEGSSDQEQTLAVPSTMSVTQIDDVLSMVCNFIAVSTSASEPGDNFELYMHILPKRIDLRLVKRGISHLRFIDDVRYVEFDGTIIKFGQCIGDGIVWHTFDANKPLRTSFPHHVVYEIVKSEKTR